MNNLIAKLKNILTPGSPSDWAILIGFIILAFILFDRFGTWGLGALLGIFSQGDNAKRGEDARAVADEHDQMMHQSVAEAVIAEGKAEKIHDGTEQVANEITQPHDPTPSGYTRRTFKAK